MYNFLKRSYYKRRVICFLALFTGLFVLLGTVTFAKEYTDKETISKVQSVLGCTADGICGKITTQAIKDYQENNDLEVTGIIDDILLFNMGIIESPVNEKPELTDTPAGHFCLKYNEAVDYFWELDDNPDHFIRYMTEDIVATEEKEIDGSSIVQFTFADTTKDITACLFYNSDENSGEKYLYELCSLLYAMTDDYKTEELITAVTELFQNYELDTAKSGVKMFNSDDKIVFYLYVK